MRSLLAFCIRLVLPAILPMLFQPVPALGQQGEVSPLGQVERLTGAGFKIPDTKLFTSPLFRAGLTAGLALPCQPGSQAVNGDILDSVSAAVFSDELLFGKLFEQLGVEFLIGGAGTGMQISNIHLDPGFSYGITADYGPGKGFRAGLSFLRHHHLLTAAFPVMVFNYEQEMPDSVSGTISSGITFNRISLEGKYFFTQTRLQPFAGLSFCWQWQKADETGVKLAGHEFRINYNLPEDNYAGGSLSAGAVCSLTRQVSAAVNIEYFFAFSGKDEIPGDGFDISLQFFWNFR